MSSNSLLWDCVSPGGPALCNHVGAFLNNCIYLHGGVTKKRSSTPSNALFTLNPHESSPVWKQIRCGTDSPALSHHAHFTISDRYLILVGGWNGKERSADVYIFDSIEEKWLKKPKVKGFPEGGGLSSHTIWPLRDNSCLIIGREGGLRTQRRAGSAFLLKYKSDLSEFSYSSHAVGTQSRSSHTMSFLSGYIFVIGGRDHNLAEVHSGIKPEPLKSIMPSALASLGDDFSKYATLMTKEPPCMKSHVAFGACSNLLLLHGGETFDGRNKGARSELYLLHVSGKHGDWYQVACANPMPRDSHVAILTSDHLYIHGGCGMKDVVCSELYKLVVK